MSHTSWKGKNMEPQKDAQVVESIKTMLNPKSIAIIGASRDLKKLGSRTMQNLIKLGYKNRIYPINPRETEIMGLRCYPSVEDVPKEIELACIFVPAHVVVEVLKACADRGVKTAIVFASGFAEVGDIGENRQSEITKIAKRSGMRICGPNCTGIISSASRIGASFSYSLELQPVPGEIGFVSQSGALGGSVLTRMWRRHVGISHFISSGNEADLEAADYIKFFAQDPHTKTIMLFLEGVRDGKKFTEAAEMAADNKKPIIVLKTGKSEKGRLSVKSHTGAMSGSDEVYNAVFRKLGIVRVFDLEELFETAMAFAWQPLPKGNRVGVVSTSGGACSIVSDKCEDYGLEIPEFTGRTIARIRKIVPPFVTVKNPLDTTAQPRGPERFKECLDAIAKDQRVDIVLSTLTTTFNPMYVQSIVEKVKEINKNDKPLILVWTVEWGYAEKLVEILAKSRVPIYPTPSRAVRTLRDLLQYSKFLKRRETS